MCSHVPFFIALIYWFGWQMKKDKSDLMRIGQLASLTGLSTSKIRFYEDTGLLIPAKRTAAGYRLYNQAALLVLDLIQRGQQAGFGLKDMKALLPDEQGKWQKASLIAALESKIQDIDALQTTLAANRQRLESALNHIVNQPDDTDCTDNARSVVEQSLK